MNGLLKMIVAVVTVSMALGVWTACSQEDPEPTPFTAPATVPAAATTSSPVSPVPLTATPAAAPIETAPAPRTETPPTISPTSRYPEGSSLRLISSRSAAAPSSALIGVSIGSHSSVVPQTVPAEGGLTVSAIGSVTVAADEAYVIVVPEQFYGPSGPEQITDDDRRQIRETLAELGIPEESVEFENLATYGPSSISVEVELDELADKRESILDAVEDVIRRYESHGVIYGLSEENCEGALSLARREAIPSAERAADDLAQALGVSRGRVIGALEYPLTTPGFVQSGIIVNACGAPALLPYPNLVPFDAEPEVEVTVGLQITYNIR